MYNEVKEKTSAPVNNRSPIILCDVIKNDESVFSEHAVELFVCITVNAGAL